MQKLIPTLLFSFFLTNALGQTQRKTSVYLNGQYNLTLSDVTIGNNPWAMGLGLQMYFRQTSTVRPTVDVTADAYLMDDKVLRVHADGTPFGTVGGMINFFVGASAHPLRNVYLSFVGGPSLTGGQTLYGIKPSIGFYFSAKQKVTAKLSYINIFNREERARQNFTSASLSFGIQLR